MAQLSLTLAESICQTVAIEGHHQATIRPPSSSLVSYDNCIIVLPVRWSTLGNWAFTPWVQNILPSRSDQNWRDCYTTWELMTTRLQHLLDYVKHLHHSVAVISS